MLKKNYIPILALLLTVFFVNDFVASAKDSDLEEYSKEILLIDSENEKDKQVEELNKQEQRAAELATQREKAKAAKEAKKAEKLRKKEQRAAILAAQREKAKAAKEAKKAEKLRKKEQRAAELAAQRKKALAAKEAKKAEKIRKQIQREVEVQVKREVAQAEKEARRAEKIRKKEEKAIELGAQRIEALAAKEARKAEKIHKKEEKAIELGAQKIEARAAKEAKKDEKFHKRIQRKIEVQVEREVAEVRAKVGKFSSSKPEGFQTKIERLDQLLAEGSLKEKELDEQEKELTLQLMGIERDKELAGDVVEDIYSALGEKEKVKQNLLWQESETVAEISKNITEQRNTETNILNVKNSLEKERQLLTRLEERAKPAGLELLRVNSEIADLGKRIRDIKKTVKLLENEFFDKQQNILKTKEKKGHVSLKIFSKERIIQKEIESLKSDISGKNQEKEKVLKEQREVLAELSIVDSKKAALKSEILEQEDLLEDEESHLENISKGYKNTQEVLVSLGQEKENIKLRIGEIKEEINVLAKEQAKGNILIKEKKKSLESGLKHILTFQKESQAKIRRFQDDLVQEKFNKEKEISWQDEHFKNATLEFDLSISPISSLLNQEKKKQAELTRQQTRIDEELYDIDAEKKDLTNQIIEGTTFLAEAKEKLTVLKNDQQVQKDKLSQVTSRSQESQQKVTMLDRLIYKTQVRESRIVSEEKKLASRLELLQKELQTLKNKSKDFLVQKEQVEQEQSQSLEGEKAVIVTLSGIEKNIEIIDMDVSQISSRLNQAKKKQDRLIRRQPRISEEFHSFNTNKEILASQIIEATASLAKAKEKLTVFKKDQQVQKDKLSEIASQSQEHQQKVTMLERLIHKTQVQEDETVSEEKKLTSRIELFQKELQTLKNKSKDFLVQKEQVEQEQSQSLEGEKAVIVTLSGIEKNMELIGMDISQISSRISQARNKQDELIRRQPRISEELYDIDGEKEDLAKQIAEAEKKLAVLKKNKQVGEGLSKQEKLLQAEMDSVVKSREDIQAEIVRLKDLFAEAKDTYGELSITKDSLKIKEIRLTRTEKNIKSQIDEANKTLKIHQAANKDISAYQDSTKLKISSIKSEIKDNNIKLLKLKALLEEKRNARQVLIGNRETSEAGLAEVLLILGKVGKDEMKRLSSLLKTKKSAERKIVIQERKMQDKISKLSPEKEVDKRVALTKLTTDREAIQREIVDILNDIDDKKIQASQSLEREKAFIVTLSGIEKNIELIGIDISQISSRFNQAKKKQDELTRNQNRINEEFHSSKADKEILAKQITEGVASLAKAKERLTVLKNDQQARKNKLSQIASQSQEYQQKIVMLSHLIDKAQVEEAEIVSEEKKLTRRLGLLQKELKTFKNRNKDFLAEKEQPQSLEREKASVITLSEIEKNIEFIGIDISQTSSWIDQAKKKQDELTRNQTRINEESHNSKADKKILAKQITDATASLAKAKEKLTGFKKDQQVQKDKLSQIASQSQEYQQKIIMLSDLIDKAQVEEAEIVSEEKKLTSRLELLQKELQILKNKSEDFLVQKEQAEQEQSQSLEREKAFIVTLSGIEKNIELIGMDIPQISSRINQAKKKQDELIRRQPRINEEFNSFKADKEILAKQITDAIASLARAKEKLTGLKKNKQAGERLSRQEKLLQAEMDSVVKSREDIQAEIEKTSRSFNQEKSFQNKLSLEKNALTEEIITLTTQQQDLKGAIEAGEKGLKGYTVKISELIQKQQALKSELNQILVFQKESQVKISRFQKDLAQEKLNREEEISRQKDEFKNATLGFDLSISQISSRIDQEKKKQDGFVREQARINKEFQSFNTEKEFLANQIIEATASLAEAEEKLIFLDKDEQIQENKLSEITSRRRGSQQKITMINRLIDKTWVQEEQLGRQEKAFKIELDNLKKDERVIQKEIEEVAVRLAGSTSRLGELTIQKRDFKRKADQFVREREVIKVDIYEFNKLTEDQETKVARLGRKQEQLEFEISEKKAEIDGSQKRIINLGKSLEEEETGLEKLNEKEKSLQVKLPKIRKSLEDVEKEIIPIQNDLEVAQKNLKDIKDQETLVNTAFGNLKTSFTILHKKFSDWGEEKWGLEMEVLEAKRKKEFAKIEKAERDAARANQEMKEILSEKRKKTRQWKNLSQARMIKEKVFKKEEEIDENLLSQHYYQAFELDYNERYHEAAMEYEEVLKINPNDADAHYNLALIYDDHLNEKRKAIQHYQEYLDLKPVAEDESQVAGWIIKARQALEWDSWD